MFVHSVYFRLRPNVTEIERERFVAGLRSLCDIEAVHVGHIGEPAPTDRPVIDRAYTHALILLFADQRAHDVYQVHPVHDRFREECSPYWESVRVFDSVSEADG